MFKWIIDRVRGDRGIHQATVDIQFSADDQVANSIFWHHTQDQQLDTVVFGLHFYARVLYELAELNETRTAKELMAYLEQVSSRILTEEGPPGRPRLRLGNLQVEAVLSGAPVRNYRAELYRLQDGGHRLEFQGSLGKESFYLPAAFLVFLTYCLDSLEDQPLYRLARGIGRLHAYYRYRRDFWDGTTLTAGPQFALSAEELRPDEAVPEE